MNYETIMALIFALGLLTLGLSFSLRKTRGVFVEAALPTPGCELWSLREYRQKFSEEYFTVGVEVRTTEEGLRRWVVARRLQSFWRWEKDPED